MNTFVIKMYLGTLTQTDWNQAEAIANTSVEIGGPATLHALVWFPEGSGQALAGPSKQKFTANGVKTNILPEDQASLEINLFPNPSNNSEMNIQAGKGIRSCEILSMNGETIGKYFGQDKESLELPIINLQTGSYILKLYFSDGSTKNLKFIK